MLTLSDGQLRQILLIGRIIRAHGIRGEVSVLPLTSDPDRFAQLKECLLLSADEKNSSSIQVENARIQPEQLLIKLKGIDTRDQAEALRGHLLAVKREDAVKLPADHWFICDLLGCAVYDAKEGYLGELADIMQNTAQDVYVVRLPGQPDLLFPALKTIIQKVDIAGRRIDICLTEGLYEVYRGGKS